MIAFERACGTHWAITPDALAVVLDILQRNLDSPALLEARAKAIAEGRWPPEPTALFVGNATRIEGARRAVFRQGVSIVPVMGPIIPHASFMAEVSGATSVDTIRNDLRVSLELPAVHGIMLAFDSPGGAVPGIQSLAEEIRAAAATKPIEAMVTGTAASAAYWLASAAQSISVERTSALGSIGVVAAVPYQEAPDKNGIRRVEVVSSNAAKKRPDARTPEGADQIREALDALETIFIDSVAEHRGVPRAKVVTEFGQGGILIGQDAVNAKMADRIETFDAAIERFAQAVAPKRNPATPRRAEAAAYLASRKSA